MAQALILIAIYRTLKSDKNKQIAKHAMELTGQLIVAVSSR